MKQNQDDVYNYIRKNFPVSLPALSRTFEIKPFPFQPSAPRLQWDESVNLNRGEVEELLISISENNADRDSECKKTITSIVYYAETKSFTSHSDCRDCDDDCEGNYYEGSPESIWVKTHCESNDSRFLQRKYAEDLKNFNNQANLRRLRIEENKDIEYTNKKIVDDFRTQYIEIWRAANKALSLNDDSILNLEILNWKTKFALNN